MGYAWDALGWRLEFLLSGDIVVGVRCIVYARMLANENKKDQ